MPSNERPAMGDVFQFLQTTLSLSQCESILLLSTECCEVLWKSRCSSHPGIQDIRKRLSGDMRSSFAALLEQPGLSATCRKRIQTFLRMAI